MHVLFLSLFRCLTPRIALHPHRGCGDKTMHDTEIGQYIMPLCQRCNAILTLAEDTRAKVLKAVLIYVHLFWSEADM